MDKNKIGGVKRESEVSEIILEIRSYLINTEFAPEPFTQPVDMAVLRGFRDKITQLFETKPDESRLVTNPWDKIAELLEASAMAREGDVAIAEEKIFKALDDCIETRQKQIDDSNGGATDSYRFGMVAGLKQFRQALKKKENGIK